MKLQTSQSIIQTGLLYPVSLSYQYFRCKTVAMMRHHHMCLLNMPPHNHGHESAAITTSTLLVSGFPQAVGAWLQRFTPIQPQGHWWSPTLMLGDQIWLTAGVPAHSKGVGGGSSQSQVLPNRENHFFTELVLCRGTLSCWDRKGPSPNWWHKVGRKLLSKILLYTLRFLLIGTNRRRPNHEDSSSPKLHKMWSGCPHTEYWFYFSVY